MIWRRLGAHASWFGVIVDAAVLILIVLLLLLKVAYGQTRQGAAMEAAQDHWTLSAIADKGGRLDRMDDHLTATDGRVTELEKDLNMATGVLWAIFALQALGLLRSWKTKDQNSSPRIPSITPPAL